MSATNLPAGVPLHPVPGYCLGALPAIPLSEHLRIVIRLEGALREIADGQGLLDEDPAYHLMEHARRALSLERDAGH